MVVAHVFPMPQLTRQEDVAVTLDTQAVEAQLQYVLLVIPQITSSQMVQGTVCAIQIITG